MREVVEKMEDRREMVDMKVVGKPFILKSDEASFAPLVKKLKNYIGAGYGRDARLMMDWAEERAAQTITDEDLRIKLDIKRAYYPELRKPSTLI